MMKIGASESSNGNEKNSRLFFLEKGQNWQTLTLHKINLAHTNHKQWQQVSIFYEFFCWIFCCTNRNSTNCTKSSFLFFNLRHNPKVLEIRVWLRFANKNPLHSRYGHETILFYFVVFLSCNYSSTCTYLPRSHEIPYIHIYNTYLGT
jgi:hypothetical protein